MIEVSEAAVAEIKRRMETLAATDRVVRIGFQSGGCSGLEYVLQFSDDQQPNDVICEQAGVVFVCNEASLPALAGLRVDYRDGLVGGGFRFINPNAVRSCGCGASFKLDDFRPGPN